jgi:hypothetical protein
MTVSIILSGSFQTAARIAPRSKFLAPPGVPNQGVEAAVLSRNRLDLRVRTTRPYNCQIGVACRCSHRPVAGVKTKALKSERPAGPWLQQIRMSLLGNVGQTRSARKLIVPRLASAYSGLLITC